MCTLNDWAEFIAMMGLIALPVMFVGVCCYLLYKLANEVA